MNREEWIAAGRPHWQCQTCMGVLVTVPIPDDFICDLCKKPKSMPLPLEIFGDDSGILVRMNRDGDMEIFGDVNEAALRFWTAVCQVSGGILTHKAK